MQEDSKPRHQSRNDGRPGLSSQTVPNVSSRDDQSIARASFTSGWLIIDDRVLPRALKVGLSFRRSLIPSHARTESRLQ
jgi:hypothetical protein